jgi:NitT/TauT family transport system substrate-binding protein
MKLKCIALTLVTWRLLSGISGSQEKRLETVKVGISSFSASYAPIFAGKKHGFFTEEGLAVEIILIPGLLGTKALIGGSVDFASASNPNAAVQGAKVKMLMIFNDKVSHVLVAQPAIKSIEALRGKKLAVSSLGSLDHGWLVELLPKFGLDPERDVITLGMGPTGARFQAMIARSIDATLLSPPQSFLAQEAGFTILARISDHLEDIVASIVSTDERLARREELALRFLKATVKGLRLYLANRQEAITALMEFARQKDPALMARVYDHHMTTIARDGTIPERLQRIVIARSKRIVGVTREIGPKEIFDFSLLKRAHAEIDRSGWGP